MAVVYIGLGSNLGDREEQVLRAVHELRAFSRVRKISTLRETMPIGITDQPKFLNAVAEIETDYTPSETMGELLRIEEEMGRTRSVKGGPREIDLDILDYNGQVLKEENVEVPHPRMHERRFALEPLAELVPAWTHPASKILISELLSKLPPEEA